jgi:hypothetical protein
VLLGNSSMIESREQEMKTPVIVAVVAGMVALVSAGVSVWGTIRVEYVKNEIERQKEVSSVREPLARAAFDLQSRLRNILQCKFLNTYLHGNDRETSYVMDNTPYLIAQYFCWTEQTRRETLFIDREKDSKTSQLSTFLDGIDRLWGDDGSQAFHIFAGEQRQIGESLVQPGVGAAVCMGYGTFLKSFPQKSDQMIEVLRSDVGSLDKELTEVTLAPSDVSAANRLKEIQNSLVDLLNILDPKNIRYPKVRETKVSTIVLADQKVDDKICK